MQTLPGVSLASAVQFAERQGFWCKNCICNNCIYNHPMIDIPDALTSPVGCTNLKLRQFMRRVSQHYDAQLGKAGLKTTQYSLLSYIAKLGPIGQSELAAHIKMSTSTLSRNLKPLVDAQWVVVLPGADARNRLVSLTDAGRLKRNEAQRRWRVAQDDINRMMGADKVAHLHALIDSSMVLLEPLPEAASGDE